MKNFIKIFVIALIILSITSCWKKDDATIDTNSNTWDVSIEETTDIEAQTEIETIPEIEDWNEYSFKLSIKNDWWMENESVYFKKWDNQLIIINKLLAPEVDNMPIKMMRMLSVDKLIYQQMEVNGKIYWTKVDPSMNWWKTSFFNLKEVSSVPEEQIKETKEEEVNWVTMTCYYFDDENGKWKWCLDNWVFMYGENEWSEWGKTVMMITDYTEKVEDNIFAIPKESEITSMEELAKTMQQIESNITEVPVETTTETK